MNRLHCLHPVVVCLLLLSAATMFQSSLYQLPLHVALGPGVQEAAAHRQRRASLGRVQLHDGQGQGGEGRPAERSGVRGHEDEMVSHGAMLRRLGLCLSLSCYRCRTWNTNKHGGFNPQPVQWDILGVWVYLMTQISHQYVSRGSDVSCSTAQHGCNLTHPMVCYTEPAGSGIETFWEKREAL